MTLLNVAIIIVAILLILAIVLQNRGTGLGAAFGGDVNSFRTKRGIEKKLAIITVALAVIFAGLSLANLFVQ